MVRRKLGLVAGVLTGVLAGVLVACAAATSAWAADDRKRAEEKKHAGDKLAADGKTDEALEKYVQAMDADSGYLPSYDAATPLWFAKQDFATAIKRLRIVVARKPKYSLGWYNLAFAYRKSKEYAKAVEAYERFIALRPEEPDPYFGLGMTYKAMGDKEKAKYSFQRYIELEGRAEKEKFVAQARAEIEAIDDAAGDRPGGDTPAGDAPQIDPATASKRDVAVARKTDGDKKRDAGDLAGAEAEYRAAIAADDTYGPPHNELGVLLFQQKKLDEALAELETATTLDPKDDLAWYNLAYARRKSGKHQEAVAAYDAAIALVPTNPDPYYGLGLSLRALKDPRARAALARYVELEQRPSEQRFIDKATAEIAAIDTEAGATAGVASPDNTETLPPKDLDGGPAPTPGVATPLPAPTAEQAAEARTYVDKGNTAFAAKQYEEAAGHYRGAVALDPTSLDARYRLGVALAAHVDLAGAISAWEGVLLVDPKHERARRNIELARHRLDDPEKQTPIDEVAVLARARQLVDDGRWASAAETLDHLLADATHAQNPAALSLRAEARLGGADAAGAILDWLTVLSLDARHVRSIRGLGDAYAAMGDKARARYYWELFLGRADSDPDEKQAAAAVRRKLALL